MSKRLAMAFIGSLCAIAGACAGRDDGEKTDHAAGALRMIDCPDCEPIGGGDPVMVDAGGGGYDAGAPPSDALDDRIRNPRPSSLTVSVDLIADPSSGATIWCDEATLTLANGAK